MSKIDILITFNGGIGFLERCLQSVSNQTFKNYKVFLAIDGTSECITQVLTKYQKKFPITTIYNKNPIGGFQSFDLLVKKSNSPFFIWLHHDDYWDPTFLSSIFDLPMQKFKSVSFSTCLYKLVKGDDILEHCDFYITKNKKGKCNLTDEIIFGNWIQWSFTVIRRESYLQIGELEEVNSKFQSGHYKTGQCCYYDSYLWVLLLKVGDCHYSHQRLGFRQLHNNSSTNKFSKFHIENVIRYNISVFDNLSMFDRETRLLSLSIVISRLAQKKNLFETAIDMLDNSLLASELKMDKENFNKKRFLNRVMTCIDNMIYDHNDSNKNRKLLSKSDKIKYQDILNNI